MATARGSPSANRVADVIRRYRDGGEIDLELAAWVTVALRELRVRDWLGADGEITLVGRRALSRWLEAAIPTKGPKATGSSS